ncbi:MAG: hypothetical protein ABTD50_04985 [Polyangiaceae bacterium]|jgi:hypothetical protein
MSAQTTLEQRAVWVLGAGFSAPLGGPLLTKMLSCAAWDAVGAHYPTETRVRATTA